MDLITTLSNVWMYLKFYGFAVVVLACGLMGLYWLGVAVLAGRR